MDEICQQGKPANAIYLQKNAEGMTNERHVAAVEICDVAGCNCESERSLNIKQVGATDLKLKSDDLKSVHLCKEHYKEYKKKSKTQRALDATY